MRVFNPRFLIAAQVDSGTGMSHGPGAGRVVSVVKTGPPAIKGQPPKVSDQPANDHEVSWGVFALWFFLGGRHAGR